MNKYILNICLLALLVSFFAFSPKAFALSPVDQVCSTGAAGSITYSFIGSNHEIYQIFVPSKNTLDAVSLRVRTEIGESSTISVQVYNVTNAPMQEIASLSQSVGQTEQWLTFDFDDVPMPLGVYVIKAKSIDEHAHAIWKTVENGCYERGYAVLDGEVDTALDFGFAVYAYDASESTPTPATQADNTEEDAQESSDQSNPSQDSPSQSNPEGDTGDDSVSSATNSSSGSVLGSIPSSSVSSGDSDIITKEEAEKIVRELSEGDSSQESPNMLGFFLVQAIVPVILLSTLFLIFVVGMILLFARRRKKDLSAQPALSATPPPTTTSAETTNKEQTTSKPIIASETKKTSKAGLIAVIIIIVVVFLFGSGFLLYKLFAGKASTTLPKSSVPIASVTANTQKEAEFGAVLQGVVGDVDLKTVTEIAGGTHILYKARRDIASDDFQQIKAKLIENGYAEYLDKKFKGENSIMLEKDGNLVRVPFDRQYISITVVKKPDEILDDY